MIVVLGLGVGIDAQRSRARRIRPHPPVSVACTTTLSGGGSINTAVSSASGGDTICLNSASNWAYSGTSQKGSDVTIRPVTGQTVSFSTMTLNNSRHLKFQGPMTFTGGATTTTSAGDARNLTFDGIAFKTFCLYVPDNVDHQITITNSTFIAGDGCGNEGRLTVNGWNQTHTVAVGVTLSHNQFGPDGCGDGIQLTGGADGVQVLYNEFTGITQHNSAVSGDCDLSPGAPHVDAIQFFGADDTVFTGNWIHGGTTGIMSPDCNGTGAVVTDNVFANSEGYQNQIEQSGANTGTYSHNTFRTGNGLRIYAGNGSCGNPTNVILKNNIAPAGLTTQGASTATWTITHNNGITGGTTIGGTVTYVGGSTPTTWAGWLQTSGVGNDAGDDGTDIGARIADLPTPGPQ